MNPNSSHLSRDRRAIDLFTQPAAAKLLVRDRILSPASMAASVVLCSIPLHAAPLVQAQAQQPLSSPTGKFVTHNAPGGTVSAEVAGAISGFAAEARSQASLGVLRLYGEAHSPNQGTNSGTFAGATAFFEDDFTISDPSRTGQGGSMTIKLAVDGTLSSSLRAAGSEEFLSSPTYAQARLLVTADGAGVFLTTERVRAYDQAQLVFEGDAIPFLNRVTNIQIPFTFGTPLAVRVQLSLISNSRSEFGSDCVVNLQNTAEWGGIAAVADSAGTPVSGYSVVSASGTNYTKPITFEPRITEFVHGIVPRVSFTTLAGRFYRVERSNTLADSDWSPLVNGTNVTGTGGVVTIEDTQPGAGSLPKRFYRVVLLP